MGERFHRNKGNPPSLMIRNPPPRTPTCTENWGWASKISLHLSTLDRVPFKETEPSFPEGE
jgi:hypothetical protein